MIQVAIVDDHKMFREGIKSIIDESPECNVVWTAGNSQEALDAIGQHLPDIILMDLTLGKESGFTLTKLILDKFDTNIIAISMHYEESYIVKILEIGAKGYLLKDAGAEEVMNAIKTVSNGDSYYSNYVSQVLIKHISRGTSPKDKTKEVPLTKREIEILTLIAQEYSNPEIASELFISVRTVDTHRRNLLDKLDVKNTAGLVKKAIKFKLLDIDESD